MNKILANRNLTHLLFVILLILVNPLNSFGCKCDSTSVENGYKKANLIVKGKILKVEMVNTLETINVDSIASLQTLIGDNERLSRYLEGYSLYKVTLEVSKIFKGEYLGKQLTIYTSLTSSACGIRFREREETIIYTTKESNMMYFMYGDYVDRLRLMKKENTYWTDRCKRLVSDVAQETKLLNSHIMALKN
ncbi:hypothetical protein EI427_21060 [Flammeovirga pectinis]|uniref:Tissue inhibitor of metalloproteinase n=1 Tax=Flammeovirga pectinis TaxID=2494373 RepID=A0A3S9P952_9BACT|nr:hypothetical protein [Flammeovirga pectinis]AZQ64716.1 hypothetical protein EI427_21060 [Flammeovirga pectinis]